MVSVSTMQKIINFAAMHPDPMAESVVEELKRIEWTRKRREELANLLCSENKRHDEAINRLIDQGLDLQRDCRHWETVAEIVGTRATGVVTATGVVVEHVCKDCGKRKIQ